jgi:hypothetical protein
MDSNEEHVAVVAHGLLSPMAAVVGGIDIALRIGELDDTSEQALHAARRQALVVTESLRKLAQGFPAEVVAKLES